MNKNKFDFKLLLCSKMKNKTIKNASIAKEQEKYNILLNKQKQKLDNWNIGYEFCEKKYEIIDSVSDFSNGFRERFDWYVNEFNIKKNTENKVSINRITNKKDREKVEFVCMVQSIVKTKNNNFILTVEDTTGEIKILINKNKKELYEKGKTIFEEDVLYVKGTMGDNIVFVTEFEYLDYKGSDFNLINKTNTQKQNIVFISDIHIGSDLFCEKEFLKFINWINDESEKSIKYIIITGDLIEGIGIYQGQKEGLNIFNYKDQYKKAYELLSKINDRIKIIITPGNHDSISLVEPQSIFSEQHTLKLYEMENLVILPNPSNLILNNNSKRDEEKIKLLIYHGYSFDYYISNNDKIRKQGGYDRIDVLMDMMLERRHLSNTFKSNMLHPKLSRNSIIKEIPNIFVTGHFHSSIIKKKKKVYMINAGCWQRKTKFQEKLGHKPDPCKAVMFNIFTKKVKVLNFSS